MTSFLESIFTCLSFPPFFFFLFSLSFIHGLIRDKKENGREVRKEGERVIIDNCNGSGLLFHGSSLFFYSLFESFFHLDSERERMAHSFSNLVTLINDHRTFIR